MGKTRIGYGARPHSHPAKQHWSNLVQIKIIRLARTISDLEGSREITDESIWKAITLRRENHTKAQVKVGKS